MFVMVTFNELTVHEQLKADKPYNASDARLGL